MEMLRNLACSAVLASSLLLTGCAHHYHSGMSRGEEIDYYTNKEQFYNLAEFYEREGKILLAAEAYEKAGSFRRAASIYIEIGNVQKAIENYEKDSRFSEAALMVDRESTVGKAIALLEKYIYIKEKDGVEYVKIQGLRYPIMHFYNNLMRLKMISTTEAFVNAGNGRKIEDFIQARLEVETDYKKRVAAYNKRTGSFVTAASLLEEIGDKLGALEIYRRIGDEKTMKEFGLEIGLEAEQKGDYNTALSAYKLSGLLESRRATFSEDPKNLDSAQTKIIELVEEGSIDNAAALAELIGDEQQAEKLHALWGKARSKTVRNLYFELADKAP